MFTNLAFTNRGPTLYRGQGHVTGERDCDPGRCTGWWLVYLPNMISSVGIMTFPIWWGKKHVPNHQPVFTYIIICIYIYVCTYHVGFSIKLNGPFSPSMSQLNPRVTNSLFGKGSCQGSWKRCHRNPWLTGCSRFIESFWNTILVDESYEKCYLTYFPPKQYQPIKDPSYIRYKKSLNSCRQTPPLAIHADRQRLSLTTDPPGFLGSSRLQRYWRCVWTSPHTPGRGRRVNLGR